MELIEQVTELLEMIEDNHYLVCPYYDIDTRECGNIDKECEAITYKDTHYLAAKNRCPHPDKTNYNGFFKQHHIHKNTYSIESIINKDELEKKPPVLRTIITLHMNYDTYRVLGGSRIDGFKLEIGDEKYGNNS